MCNLHKYLTYNITMIVSYVISGSYYNQGIWFLSSAPVLLKDLPNSGPGVYLVG